MGDTAANTCPHCGAANPVGSAFCESCGKALPLTTGGPRVLTGDVLPTSAGGRQMMSDELVKQTKRAANALLVVGILQLVCGAIIVGVLVAMPSTQNLPGKTMAVVLGVAQLIVAGVFIGLHFWARRSPLPATITGLVVYGTLLTINVVSSVARLSEHPDAPRTGFGGLGIGWIDIVIIAMLVQGIQAAVKHKKLIESGAV